MCTSHTHTGPAPLPEDFLPSQEAISHTFPGQEAMS